MVQEEYEEPLPPHPHPATSSAAPAKKKKKKKSSRPRPDMAAMMQSFIEAMQRQQQQSSSDSSDDELADEVFEEPPLPPLPEPSPLADDLAISSSDEDEALLVADRRSPALPEVPMATEESPQPEETSYPDLLSHPPPSTEEELSMPAVDLTFEGPPPVIPGPSTAAPVTSEDPTTLTPSLANVTTQSVLFRPLRSQTMILKFEEGGEITGSFMLDGELFGAVTFLDESLCSFRIPNKLLIKHMAHILHRCSFSPFSSESKELHPAEHCVLLRQALDSVEPRGHKLSVCHEKDVTYFKSPEDFDALATVRKAAERVVESFKGDFSKLPIQSKHKTKPKVCFQASGPLASYLDAPLLDISRMHREDNIQAIVSTPRPSLVLEEKDSRDQLRRAVEFHELFSQAAKFTSALQKSASTQDRGSIIITLKDFASYFSLCSAAFEREVTYFSEIAARKKMEVRLAAMDNFINPSLRTTFMSADPLSVNLVTPEAARDTVKAIKDLPDRVLEKAFKDPNLPMKAVKRKPTRPTLIKIPQKQGSGSSIGYQNKPSTSHQYQHPKSSSSHPKKSPPGFNGNPQPQHKSSHHGSAPFPKRDKQGGGKARDRHQDKRQEKEPHHRRRH